MSISRDEWLVEVNRTLRELYFIGSDDAGWGTEEIDRYFSYGMHPREFVLWFGEKYGLIGHELFLKS